MKERMLQRIEPWIQRELTAILGDPDPSIIVHVASSLYIGSLEGKLNPPSRLLGVKHDFLAPLQRFLHNQTAMFWHELRYINDTIKASWKHIGMESNCEIYMYMYIFCLLVIVFHDHYGLRSISQMFCREFIYNGNI